MQKKLIALAIAGFAAAPAFAQSNVTMYGVADVYFASAGASGAKTQTAINSSGLSGSRIGFKGAEDLGNGLKAVFTLEYGLDLDQNTGIGTGVTSTSPARQQFVGVAGGFGTVVAGRLQTAGYDWSCGTNPLAGSALDSVGKLGVSTLLTCGGNGRANNAIAYISPSFNGLTLAVNHGRVTESANANPTGSDSYANLLSASYANGPLTAGLVYSKLSAKATVADDDTTEWGLGGSYNFGMATAFANYQRSKTGSAASNSKYSLAAAFPVTAAGTIVAQFAANKIDGSNNDSKGYTLAYTHALSKRTTLYTGYNRITNESAVALPALGGVVPTLGGSGNVFAAGMNHKF